MKKIIITIITLATVIAASFSSIEAKDSKPFKDGIEKFKSINVSANVKLRLVEDSCYNIVVLSPDSILRKAIKYNIDGDGVLKIFDKHNDTKSRPVNVVITGPRTSLEVKAGNGYTFN